MVHTRLITTHKDMIVVAITMCVDPITMILEMFKKIED